MAQLSTLGAMDSIQTHTKLHRLWRALIYFSCFAAASVAGWFAFQSFGIVYLDQAFPPIHRSWPAGWFALIVCFIIIGAGIFLMRWRHFLFGFAVCGFASGCAAMITFGLILLKVLPSC